MGSVINLKEALLERIDISAEDGKMLSDLAEFAALPDCLHWADRENGLIPPSKVPEHLFYIGPYRGTFSHTKMPDGIVYRTMALAQPEGMPPPGAAASIAEALGFTGSRHVRDSVKPGADWQLGFVPDEPGYLVLMQPLVTPSAN